MFQNICFILFLLFWDENAKLEIEDISSHQKELIRSSWKVVIFDLGQSLCYVGDSPVEMSSSEPGKHTPKKSSVVASSFGVSSAFIQLFEEYPRSQDFFTAFKGTPIEEIQSNVILSQTLQEHAVRVFQLVEKVIGRMEPSIEKVCNL